MEKLVGRATGSGEKPAGQMDTQRKITELRITLDGGEEDERSDRESSDTDGEEESTGYHTPVSEEVGDAPKRGKPTKAASLQRWARERAGSLGSLDKLIDRQKRKRAEGEKEGQVGHKKRNRCTKSPEETKEAGKDEEMRKMWEKIREIVGEKEKEKEETRKQIEGMKEEIREIKRREEEKRSELERRVKELEQQIREEGQKRETEQKKDTEEKKKEIEEKVKEAVKEIGGREAEGGKVMGEKIKRIEAEVEGGMREIRQRIEVKERQEKRNNIIIKGLDRGGEEAKKVAERFLRENLKTSVRIREARTQRLGREREGLLVHMEDDEAKKEIMMRKKMLEGTEVYIDDDLTWKEREIQRNLVKKMKEIRGKGGRAKVGYKKIWIEGGCWLWNEEKDRLEKGKEGAEKDFRTNQGEI